jgi:type IX secretion system PorP/SprF family membrane protein
MKKIFLTAAYIYASLVLQAQQKPHYSQYILNNFMLNPALTGIENYTDIRLGYRSQWTGIPGAPVTAYFSIHTPLGKKDFRTSATSFRVPGENPRGNAYWEDYTAAEPHHGIGAIFLNDRSGFINRSSGFVTYSYHIGLSARTSLAAGFMGGVSHVSLDRNKIDWASLDPNDPAIGYSNGELNKWQPEAGAGVWLYSADYFAGVSVLNIVPGKTSFTNNTNYGNPMKPHLFLIVGYRFLLTEEINVLPSVMAKYVAPLEPQYDINCKLQYLDLLWVGASYRYVDQLGGWAAMGGVNVSNLFNISYAYEMTTSGLQTYARGTHEILLGFLLGNNYGDTCPRNVW